MAESPRLGTGGVDTHKDLHVAAIVDHLGGVIATEAFTNDGDGHRALLEWMQRTGTLETVGVEGTGSYGAGLARLLQREGVVVVEINRPDRATRRREGKSDALDAIAAARAAVAGRHAGVPKSADGTVEAIRMLRACRRSAIQSRTQCANQVHALVDTAPEAIAHQLRSRRWDELVERVALLPSNVTDLADPAAATCWALRALTTRWEYLDAEIGDLDEHLAKLVPGVAPNLIALHGVGIDTAGALLVAAGDNPERLRNEAAFAALCGVSPIPASSGKTNRHRLNRGGNREANQALWRIALVRMATDPPTRAYVDRRTKEGLSKREIIRCLKRYIARQVFPHLQHLDRR
jgi:transposase